MYSDRHEAGTRLASLLNRYRQAPRHIVLALPRGGVPIAAVVARVLQLPLDVLLVRKLGVPGHEEYAMGAIASGGVRVMNSAAAELSLSKESVDAVVWRERAELARREAAYRPGRASLRLEGMTALLIDDGLATGATMRAAVSGARAMGAARVVVAVPVGSAEACAALKRDMRPKANTPADLADDVICASTPSPFFSVGQWYEDFTQVSDAEVLEALAAAGDPGTRLH